MQNSLMRKNLAEMRVGNNNVNNNLVNIYSQMNILKPLFSDIFLVNPVDKTIIQLTEYGITETKELCCSKCPLVNDRCGCICKDTTSTNEDRCRFVYTKTEAHLVISKPIILKYRNYVMVMVMKLNPKFSFGAISETEAIDNITKVSSNLVIDPLTQIFNRKYLMDNIGHMMRDASSKNKCLNLACIDIDNFKKFNDTYGHDFGDRVLQKVASTMVEAISVIDEAYPIRIGGDEFVIVAVNIDKNRFKAIMNKLCFMIEDSKLPYESELVGIKISIGVSEMINDHIDTYKELYDRADEQLYKAKEAGKGCVR